MGQTLVLLTLDGRVLGVKPVDALDALAGSVSAKTLPLDDGSYEFVAALVDANNVLIGTAPVHVTIVTDLDGIAPSIELAANNGDFNRDGIADWSQNNVAQLPVLSAGAFAQGKAAPAAAFGAIIAGSVDSLHAAGPVVLDATAQLQNLSILAAPAALPPAWTAASDLFDFSVTGQAGGQLQDLDPARTGLQTRVVIELAPGGVAADTYVKWDPATGSWFEFRDDGNLDTFDDGATLVDFDRDGRIDRLVVTLTDGGAGDSDHVANGIVIDPGMLVLVHPEVAPAATPVWSVLLANGDRYYSNDANEAARMAQGAGNVFEGSRFDSLSAAQGGRQLYANHNPFTTDWYFAADGQPMPYFCYERVPGAGFFAAGAGGSSTDFHLYLDSSGITQLASVSQAQALDLAARGFADWGVVFSTTTSSAFDFDAEGYLVANASNQAVRDLVLSLSGAFARTTDGGFVDAVEQHYLANVQLIGVAAHGGSATAADVNAAFGTNFVS